MGSVPESHVFLVGLTLSSRRGFPGCTFERYTQNMYVQFNSEVVAAEDLRTAGLGTAYSAAIFHVLGIFTLHIKSEAPSTLAPQPYIPSSKP